MEILAVRLIAIWFLIYPPDDTNVNGSRNGKFEGIGSVYVVESCEIGFLGHQMPYRTVWVFTADSTIG